MNKLIAVGLLAFAFGGAIVRLVDLDQIRLARMAEDQANGLETVCKQMLSEVSR